MLADALRGTSRFAGTSLLCLYVAAPGWPAAKEAAEAARDVNAGDDLAGALLLGRTEYTVRSLDAVTGAERWNVTFAELAPLGAAEVPGRPPVLPLAPGGARLVLGADQTLRSVGPDGRERWSLQLASAAVSMYATEDGGRLRLVPLSEPSAPAQEAPDWERIAVGAHAFGLYALPAAHLAATDSGAALTTAQARMPALPAGKAGLLPPSALVPYDADDAAQAQQPAAPQLQLVDVAHGLGF